LLHHDSVFPAGHLVLEPGCGIAAQTVTLASRNPDVRFVSLDVARASLLTAAKRIAEFGLRNVRLLSGDLNRLPFPDRSFDHVFVCHLLEHLPNPVDALRSMMRAVRPGGSVTVIEGDHGSCYFNPMSDEALGVWRCLIRVQADLGGDSLIGRRLYSVVEEAGGLDPVVSPRVVYADPGRPEVMDAFVARTIVPMVEGVEKQALRRGYMTASTWTKGIADLNAIVSSNVGAFCYTFFKAVARVG
jgi:ubiquinone/menaquinone biosynthesis C-methylase UbiE